MPKIGQYIPRNSSIHSKDPRTKILVTLFFTVSIFFYSSFISYAIIFFAVFIIILKTGVPFGNFLNTIKGVVSILLLTVFFNLFWSKGGNIIWSLGIFKITDESLSYAVKMLLRLVLLVISSSIMTMTTSPMDLTAGIEAIFSPLKKFKLPIGEMATMISIALRFVPILLDEAERIYKAQASRGANFNSGNLIERAKKLLPILIPLFSAAISRADELSVAMESRCYSPGSSRTKRCPLCYKSADIIFIFGSVLFLAGLFLAEYFIF